MDYYNLTVFEFVTTKLGSQGTICAGGRYDYLTEQIGGKPAPAVGWAIGVERVLELLKEQSALCSPAPLDAYAIVPNVEALPLVSVTLQKMRELGLTIQMHASTADGMGSMKSQFKRADASGARYALVFGADELAHGKVAVKPLRDFDAVQVLQPVDNIDAWAKSLQFSA
jgi:histidyl-tRNA synthetase